MPVNIQEGLNTNTERADGSGPQLLERGYSYDVKVRGQYFCGLVLRFTGFCVIKRCRLRQTLHYLHSVPPIAATNGERHEKLVLGACAFMFISPILVAKEIRKRLLV